MPDDVIDKLHRMARQQKSNPGLVFADCNLNPEEYDDDDDDETYHDNNNSDDEDDDDLSYNEEDDNDDEETALGPPAAGGVAAPNNNVDDDGVDDDGPDTEGGDDAEPLITENDDDDEDQADTQPSAEVGQPPNAATWEATGARDVDHDEEHDGPDLLGIPGVSDEEIGPETPGVSAGEDDETSENGDDQPTLDRITDLVQPAQPGENNGKKGRYNLCSDRSRSYNHHYAGNRLRR